MTLRFAHTKYLVGFVPFSEDTARTHRRQLCLCNDDAALVVLGAGTGQEVVSTVQPNFAPINGT